MKNKTLIISASTGSGHVRAGEALKKRLKGKNQKVEHIDMVNYVSLPMKTAVVKSYTLLANKLPELWGLLYKKSNNKKLKDKFNKATKKIKQLNSTNFFEYIEDYSPDKIICTHFLPADLISNTPKSLSKELSLLITDYGLHELWVVEEVDEYRVATKKMKWLLQHKGISNEKIKITGIPVDPVFNKKESEKKLRSCLDLPDKPMFLVLSGGQGLGQVSNILEGLFKTDKEITLVAIAGKNEKLEKKLKQKESPDNIFYKAIGWTDRIDKYMKLSRAIISKPGGMTVSEAKTINKPIIAVDPIPGQEEENTKHVVNNGHGYLANTSEDILYLIEKKILKN